MVVNHQLHYPWNLPPSEAQKHIRLIDAAPALLDAALLADTFFQANDDFTDGGEYPIPGFIHDMRNAIIQAIGRDHYGRTNY